MSAENQSAAGLHTAYIIVDRFFPFFRREVDNNYHDAEDVCQELKLKFALKFERDPGWWDRVENGYGYVMWAGRNMAFDLRKRSRSRHVSLTDKESKISQEARAAEADFVTDLDRKIDYEPFRLQMRKILEDGFSRYEKKLIVLKMFQGCRPALVADIMILEYRDILAEKYPERVAAGRSEDLEFLKTSIAKDCNLAEAKFRHKLRRTLRDLDLSR